MSALCVVFTLYPVIISACNVHTHLTIPSLILELSGDSAFSDDAYLQPRVDEACR